MLQKCLIRYFFKMYAFSRTSKILPTADNLGVKESLTEVWNCLQHSFGRLVMSKTFLDVPVHIMYLPRFIWW